MTERPQGPIVNGNADGKLHLPNPSILLAPSTPGLVGIRSPKLLTPRVSFEIGGAEEAEINRQVDILTNHFPKSPAKPAKTETGERQLRSPVVIAGDWHPEAVEIAKNEAVKKLVARFIHTSKHHRQSDTEAIRARTATDIRTKAHMLSDRTIVVWEKFTDTELRTRDYVAAGLDTIQGDQARNRLMLEWGTQESGHPLLLMNALEDAGVITKRERLAWERQAFEKQWHVEDHGELGINDYDYVEFATYQEKQTVENYGTLWLLGVIDYYLQGYSQEAIQDALKTVKIGKIDQEGMLEPFRVVFAEEGAHHGMYVDLSKTLFKFLPRQVISSMRRTQNGFHMPGYDRDPEIMTEIVEALYGTPRDVFLSYIDTFNDTCQRHGFENRNALKKADRESEKLAEGPARFVIYKPDGSFEDLPLAA